VHDSITYNTFVTYRVSAQNRYLNNTNIRFGIVNLLNSKPPLSSDSRGYDPSQYNLMARGLSWSLQLTKKF
jgi:outer membrane receptor protein involved in Fe transport